MTHAPHWAGIPGNPDPGRAGRQFSPPEEYDGTLWTVFDREGRVLGLVETPGGLTIFEIGEDYILAKVTDDLGVEYVRLWGLMRSG